jgi:hypothetical protein
VVAAAAVTLQGCFSTGRLVPLDQLIHGSVRVSSHRSAHADDHAWQLASQHTLMIMHGS